MGDAATSEARGTQTAAGGFDDETYSERGPTRSQTRGRETESLSSRSDPDSGRFRSLPFHSQELQESVSIAIAALRRILARQDLSHSQRACCSAVLDILSMNQLQTDSAESSTIADSDDCNGSVCHSPYTVMDLAEETSCSFTHFEDFENELSSSPTRLEPESLKTNPGTVISNHTSGGRRNAAMDCDLSADSQHLEPEGVDTPLGHASCPTAQDDPAKIHKSRMKEIRDKQSRELLESHLPTLKLLEQFGAGDSPDPSNEMNMTDNPNDQAVLPIRNDARTQPPNAVVSGDDAGLRNDVRFPTFLRRTRSVTLTGNCLGGSLAFTYNEERTDGNEGPQDGNAPQ